MFFEALSKLVETTQHLIDCGWRFTYTWGRDGIPSRLLATKNNRVESTHEGFDNRDVEEFLTHLCRIEHQLYNQKITNWIQDKGSECPNCHTKPPTGTYKCNCGWQL